MGSNLSSDGVHHKCIRPGQFIMSRTNNGSCLTMDGVYMH